MLPERYWQGRRYCNFPYMWLNLPCSADPRFIRRKRYGQHYSRLLLRLPYHFQGSHVPTRKRRTTGVKGSSLGCDKDLAARKGPRYRSSERIGILGAVADSELILQSLFGSGSSRNAGISPGFTLGSEEKLLLRTVWRRERDSNPRYPFG